MHSFHFLRGIFGFVLETDPLAQIKTLRFWKKFKNWQNLNSQGIYESLQNLEENLCNKVKMESKLKYLEKYGFSTDDGDKKKKKKKKSKVKDVGG